MAPLVSDPFTITMTAVPGADRAYLALAGDVDLPARPLLADAVDRVAEAAPLLTVVDLAQTTYAGAVLLDFLAGVREVLPAEATLLICRATPFTDRVLHLMDVSRIGTVRHDLPAEV